MLKKREKYYVIVRIVPIDSEWMIQLLLFSIYVLVMGMLISAVINEPISGVIILIIGVPVTAIYLALAIGGVIISGLSRKNLPEKKWTERTRDGQSSSCSNQTRAGDTSRTAIETKKDSKMDNFLTNRRIFFRSTDSSDLP